MSRFVTKKVDLINGRQVFEELVILHDNTNISALNMSDLCGVWESYENELEDKYRGSFRGLVAIMDRVANLQSVSKDKFRDITPGKELVKEYEFKYQDLRAYAIKIPNGKLILLGGYKNQQGDDEIAFRALKAKYLQSIKIKK